MLFVFKMQKQVSVNSIHVVIQSLRLTVHVAMDNRVLPAVIASRGAHRDFFFRFIKMVSKLEVIVIMYRV